MAKNSYELKKEVVDTKSAFPIKGQAKHSSFYIAYSSITDLISIIRSIQSFMIDTAVIS